jgi:signal transduction histidine kinase
VSVQKTNDGVKISVTDNGQGIGDTHQEKIFDMFYRATDNKPGSGLGLYILKEALKKIKGRVEVESVIGEGTTFTLFLPNLVSDSDTNVALS